MSRHMLVFSLGPVQSLITQARKTRDLWIGSLLLSKLMEAAMKNIQGQIVFPTSQTVDVVPDIPNKYVAIFDALDTATKAAEQSQEQIKEYWEGICQKVWDEVIADYGDEATESIWQRQTSFDGLFEVYWATVASQEEGEEAEKDYGTWLDEAEILFAARKRLRDFQARDEPGEKSAISGEREALRRQHRSQGSDKDFWKDIARNYSPRDIDQDGNERLDAIDTIKRFATLKDAIPQGEGAPLKRPFPSTSTIAVASFLERVLEGNDPHSQAFQRWREVTKGKLASKLKEAVQDIPFLAQKAAQEWQWLLQRDGDLYFPAIFTRDSLRKNYRLTDPTIPGEGKRALRDLLRKTDELNITRPTPYYAVMQMDGDNMGLLLSGTTHEDQHKAISGALSAFAREDALSLVENQYPARLVYAGGDDVLAFAPLARDATEANQRQPLSVLELAYRLQESYRKRLEAVLPTATASMGIAIAHHYTSLSYVLRSVRQAEATAKHHYDRNALVVTVLRRSGEQTRIGCHWNYPGLEDDGQPIKLFTYVLALFKNDILSPKCVYILLEEAPTLVGLGEKALISEIGRVLSRQLDIEQFKQVHPKIVRGKSDAESEEKLIEGDIRTRAKKAMDTLAKYIVQLSQAMDAEEHSKQEATSGDQKGGWAVELHSTKRRYGIVEVLGWLLAMAFLARKDQELE